jgi:uncharacterized phage protein gp47/JayE
MQIDYTSRDFAALKSDLITLIGQRTNTSWNPTDFSDLGNVLVEAFSYMGDIMSHYLDRIANETSIDTAIQTSTLLSLANLYDYKISGPTPAVASVLFTNVGSVAIDIPVGTQVMAPLSYGPYSQVYFEVTSGATALAPTSSITLSVQEGKTVNTDRPDLIDSTYNKPLPANLGTSSGLASQVFDVIDLGVVDASINVYVGQGVAFTTWNYVDNLLEWGPTDTVFTTTRDANGLVQIVFGDNVNGAIPPAGQLISCLYRSSVGAAGNVVSGAISLPTFIPGNLDPQATTYITVSNSAPASGGADGDDGTQIKKKIKAALSAQGRAVTLNDYSNLALTVPGVGKASTMASVYSSVRLYIQTPNDNSPTPGFPSATIVSLATTGSAVTFTTRDAHGFSTGDYVQISGVNPSSYNTSSVIITSVSTTYPYTFTIASSNVASYVSGGYAFDLTPTPAWTAIQTSVSNALAENMLVGTTLTILPPAYVPVYITATLNVSSAYKNSDIQLTAYQAMLGSTGVFAYDNNTFGETIALSAITAALQGIPGVISANVTVLNTTGAASAGTVVLQANQIGYLTTANLSITATGGM